MSKDRFPMFPDTAPKKEWDWATITIWTVTALGAVCMLLGKFVIYA